MHDLARIRAVSVCKVYHSSASAMQIQDIMGIKQSANRLRNQPDRRLIGDQQLAQLRSAAGSDAEWLLVIETTNVHDIIPDFLAAPALVECVSSTFLCCLQPFPFTYCFMARMCCQLFMLTR